MFDLCQWLDALIVKVSWVIKIETECWHISKLKLEIQFLLIAALASPTDDELHLREKII